MTAENKPLNAFLSKSLFLRGLQCYKSLYLHKLHPELRDETSVEEEAAFQTGHDVGLCARQLFQGGVEIPYKGLSVEKQISLTLSEIEKGADTVYEASFSYDGVFVKVDILHRGKHGWEIYEVKAAADIKDVYVADLAIQYYALKGAG